ncbi:MAG: flavodoxin [Oscillospiraceae bacterium]|nr:flavodoxin [Oscillospiraceae bacterium]
MKKIAAILAAALVLTLTACSSTDNNSLENTSSASQSTANSTSTESPSASESAADNSVEQSDNSPAPDNNESYSNILIAYFTAAENSGVDAVASASYSTVNGEPVGRLRAIANMIQAETGGELFSIRTSVVYPADGGELIDYAAEEQRENARPELTSHIDDLDKYDTIFVGYPNWWADLPQVMYSFFDEYDFSGKTIIPFNVHNGSRLSGTVGTIAELEPNANVVTDAFTISERSVPEAASEVKEWLDGLEY